MITRRQMLLALALPTVLYPAVSAAMAFGLTRTRRLAIHDTPEAVGLDYEEVSFPSADGGVELSGWLMPPPARAQGQAAARHTSRDAPGLPESPVPDPRPERARAAPEEADERWVVIVHGFGSHRGDPAAGALGLAKDLHGEGFGVLAFDMRGCGRAGGRGGSAGYHERSDLLGALGLLAKRGARWRRTGVLGFSLGGAVAITACMRPGVAGGVVADSSFADLWEIIRANATGLRRPAAWFHTGMDTFARWMYGINIAEVSPVTAVAGSQTPLLIIHGDRNPVVPAVHARMLWEAARRDARRDGGGASRRDEAGQARALELWLAPGAGHVQAYHTLREEYVRRVSDFFTRTLGCRTGLSQR